MPIAQEIDLAPPVARKNLDKLAEQIASAIESEILAARWPVGTRIGNEMQLARRYGVSRWIMREAVAILEQNGSLSVRCGNRGGLFIAAPAAELIRNSISAYLESTSIAFSALVEVRLVLTKLA